MAGMTGGTAMELHPDCPRSRPARARLCLAHRRHVMDIGMLTSRRSMLVRAEKEGSPLGSGELGRAVEDSYQFDEGAAQVQRLLQRDRKELMGVEEIGEGFRAEFDEESQDDEDAADDSRPVASAGASTSGRPSTTASSNGSPFAAGSGKANPFGKATGAVSPFGTPTVRVKSKSKSPSGPGNPFNGAGGQKLFSEYDGRLSPTMEPDEFEEKPWWQQISLGQVLIVLSFTLIIALMIGTFTVVYKVGGIRFNE